ncbi:MAG TPA: FkbM family methyltransferase [Povalibacter sp.]|nr:FkbM family methyltransferase [Povalibacter sp.]
MKVHLHKRVSRSIRGRLRSRVLAECGIGIVAATRNGTLVVDPGDFNVARDLLERGEYDWSEVALLSRLVDSSSRIVFAGAHIGALLVPIVRSAGTRSVVAYEPSPRNHRMLRMNLLLNEIEGVAVENCAVGDAAGTVRFTENRINSGNSRISRDSGEIQVAVVTLDASLPTWPTIDLLVVDVEGFEVNVMRGAPQTLARTQRLYSEFAPEQLQEQGSTVQEFVDLAAAHFSSVYVMGREPRFLRRDEFPAYLKGSSTRRGRLLNLLFTRDSQPDARLFMKEADSG